jgi:UPF0755 protein
MYFKKILLSIAVIGLIVCAWFANFVYQVMLTPNTNFQNQEAFIWVSKDDNYQDVKKQLEPLLEDIETFDVLAKQKQYDQFVKPGRYRIEKGMTNNDIINSIRSNNIPVVLSFNNQNSIEELAGRIAFQIDADSTSLVSAMRDDVFNSKHGFSSATQLGMYIPNSYEVFWNTDAEKFTQRMLSEYQLFWTNVRTERAEALGMTKNEVMTLASIVYEESKQKKEQPIIAGVYINRLKNNWLLQADPTLKFAAYKLPKYKNTMIKRVLNEHKKIESPYNTYKNTGLPPGLITMPDISAIDAVLNYKKHSFFYFAADANNPGFHKFARTLKQHNNNARDYQNYLSKKGIKR